MVGRAFAHISRYVLVVLASSRAETNAETRLVVRAPSNVAIERERAAKCEKNARKTLHLRFCDIVSLSSPYEIPPWLILIPCEELNPYGEQVRVAR